MKILKEKLPFVILLVVLIFLVLFFLFTLFLIQKAQRERPELITPTPEGFVKEQFFQKEGQTFQLVNGEIKTASSPFQLLLQPAFQIVEAGKETSFTITIGNMDKVNKEFEIQPILSSPTPDNPQIKILLSESKFIIKKGQSKKIELKIQTSKDTPPVSEFEEGYTLKANIITAKSIYTSDEVKLYVQ